MPFPLAHPAAALPFRRWCPRYFDFSALVVGSLVPDLAASIDDWEYFSHTVLGSFIFCLPVGLLTLWILYQVRGPLIATLPNRHRDLVSSFCVAAPNSLIRLTISLLLDSWLHISWDLFTHEHSWLVRHSVLSTATLGGLRLNQVVWLVSSIAGVVILLVRYFSLLRTRNTCTKSHEGSDGRAYALWISILAFPFIGAIPLTLHDSGYYRGAFLPFLTMYYFGCCYITLAVAGLLMKYQQRQHYREQSW